MKLLSRPRFLLPAAALCLALFPPAGAQNAKQDKAHEEQGKAGASGKKDSAPARRPPLPPRRDPRDFPPGVTVLIEGWTAPPAPGDFPKGVTPLAPRRPGEERGPVIRITLPPASPGPGAEAVTAPAKPKPRPDRGRDLTRAPAEQLEEEEEPPPTVGPGMKEQLAVFGRKPLPGGWPLSERAGWSPVSSLEPRDPEHPYPWNPAEFAEEIIDPYWEPSSDYQAGDPEHPYPWNPATFSPFIIDPYWEPTDSWGRPLSVPESFERYSLVPSVSADQPRKESTRKRTPEPAAGQPGRNLAPVPRKGKRGSGGQGRLGEEAPQAPGPSGGR